MSDHPPIGRPAMRLLLLCAAGLLSSSDAGLAADGLCNERLQQAIRGQTALLPTEITGQVSAIGDQREWLGLTDGCGSVRVNVPVLTVPQSCRIGSRATLTAFSDAGDLQDSISVGGEPWVETHGDSISCR